MMEISYIHTQKRKEFGKQCLFADVGPHLIVDIDPDPSLKDDYFHITAVDRDTQCSHDMSLHEVNTVSYPTESRGMSHMEGGWPADVDHRDDDQVARYKKKIEKDENYVNTVKNLSDFIEKYVMENNSIDIYEEYFVDDGTTHDGDSLLKTLNVYRDFNEFPRSVLDLSWSLDRAKFAAAYSFKELQNYPVNACIDSYVWDVENSSVPCSVLKPEALVNCIEYSPRDLEVLVGGYCNGQIALWDARAGGHPQQVTPVKASHKEVVSDMKWTNTKTGTEFFSVSTDGKLMSWDVRNLSTSTQTVSYDPADSDIPNLEQAYSLTCLEYDPTLPQRYMLGTEQGDMLACNRKIKTPDEMVSAVYYASSGPLLKIERNAFFPRLFASCGAWGVKIWSEEITESPLLNMLSKDGYVTDTAWSPTRASFLFVTKTTGTLELWDMLIKHHEPVVSLKLESDALLCVSPKEYGEQVACGTFSGCVHLLEIPHYYRSISKHEKNLVAFMLDREGKREKLLEGKTREQRLREKEEEEALEVTARLKAMEIDKTWAPEDRAEDLYDETKEFDTQFGRERKDEEEAAEGEFLETLSFEIQVEEILRRVLETVTQEVESDNSRFPFKEYDLKDFEEDHFLSELISASEQLGEKDDSLASESVNA